MLTVLEIPIEYCDVYQKLDKQLEYDLDVIKSVSKYKVNLEIDRGLTSLKVLRLQRLDRYIDKENILKLNSII
jgi:hypothetical protein